MGDAARLGLCFRDVARGSDCDWGSTHQLTRRQHRNGARARAPERVARLAKEAAAQLIDAFRSHLRMAGTLRRVIVISIASLPRLPPDSCGRPGRRLMRTRAAVRPAVLLLAASLERPVASSPQADRRTHKEPMTRAT